MCDITLHRAARSDQDDDTDWTVNDILRQFGPAYLNKYRDRMSLDQIRALEALARCRMPEAGSVAYRCRECAALHHVPKSCGNRHCPGCQGEKAREWLAEQQARLLPCAYFLMTFTMPAEFRRFARSHPRECYRALFEAANQAMCELAKNPKHLGSDRLGMTGVLHTWGRDLNYHPHVHFIVPGGALSRDGKQWIASRVNFFLPVRALSILFRAKYKECLRNAGLLGQVRNEVWRRAWIVNCQAVGDGRDALRYLAPYVFRVAIGNHRIRRVVCHEDGTGTVTFLVKPSGQRRYRPMTVTAEEFIRRFLQHVLPRGFQKVRHYGFMHKRSKVRPRWLEMLVTVTLNMVYVLNVTCEIKPPKPQRRCPDCGGVLDCLGYRPPPR
ncbi:MAG: transposase, partial [Planctomycetales bacterium]|nr:transposase [Planctomycetales bacterium]